jgi:hypothetical protein
VLLHADGGPRVFSETHRRTGPVVTYRKDHMSILWIIIIVVLVLALLGFFGRGRFSR